MLQRFLRGQALDFIDAQEFLEEIQPSRADGFRPARGDCALGDAPWYIACSSSSKNGSSPHSKAYMMHPVAHMSTAGVYSCPVITSGATYAGEPHCA